MHLVAKARCPGNSVRGIDFCQRLVNRFNFHVYDGLGMERSTKIDPRFREDEAERRLVVDLRWAPSEVDCDGLNRLILRGADPNAADYDGRTPLHLAASEGRVEAIRLLLELGAVPGACDRWGNAPRDDAVLANCEEAVKLLESAARSIGAAAMPAAEPTPTQLTAAVPEPDEG